MNKKLECDIRNYSTPFCKAYSDMRQAHRSFKEAIENEIGEEVFLIS